MHRTRLILAAALCAAATAFAQPMPGPALPLPTIAGGNCGVVLQIPMPEVKASLYYWRCTDGREVYFHVRNGWAPETQSVDDQDAVRAELLGLGARARADRIDQAFKSAVMRAVTKARSRVA